MADIGPKNESFFGRTEQQMDGELRKVDEAFQGHEGYAGLAFFMYSAYKAMAQVKLGQTALPWLSEEGRAWILGETALRLWPSLRVAAVWMHSKKAA